MMMSLKRIEICPDQWTMLSGKENYSVDLPDADLDVICEWKCDADATVWLVFRSGMRMPYSSGRNGHFAVLAKGIAAVEVATLKRATLCLLLSYREMSRSENLDYTPVEIVPPEPMQLQMSHIVSSEVQRQLMAMGIPAHAALDVDEDDDLSEGEDEEELDFGGGFAEDDNPVKVVPSAPAEKGAGAGGAVGDVGDGGKPDSPPSGSAGASG